MDLKFLIILFLSLSLMASEISFNRDIQPILSDRCYACHGPDGGEYGELWEGGLRLDTPEGAFANLREVKYRVRAAKRKAQGKDPGSKPSSERYAIIPGKPDESTMVERIMSDDEDEIMPPIDSHLSLNEQEKKLIYDWIAQGAKYDKHWAFVAPVKAPLFRVNNSQWPRNEIDYFVLEKLQKEKVKPNPELNKLAWLRRVTQDLTSLPPSLEEIKSFRSDQSSDAYEKVVEGLLNSDHYAERMANIWMDNARYADSNGYQFDNARTMWPWRDWVIKAFQDNKPWNEFVTEQLAGDLLPSPNQDQLIATGFLRNHGYSIEGGIIDEEYRVDYAKDKTHTVGTLFLGLTMECTSCHDHKYDPLSMKDYYSLYAFFNTSAEKGAPGEKGRMEASAHPYINLGQKKSPLRVMIMKEQARESFILKQGLYDQPGEKVEPETPEVLNSFESYEKNRLGLANWLQSAQNPLFARVTVNRIWQQFFGRGIVKSVDNLGLQSDSPSHRKLLDWLAVDFREKEWDLHHLIKKIVLSATYRQDSYFRADFKDAENRFLSRGPSFRLEAEQIRDQALFVSGLLSNKVGGPSVKPYQPEGVWEDLNAPKKHAEVYKESNGKDLYRKSLYTYWRRAVLHPGMGVFDAPSRDVCSVKRESTNTPLQALAVLHGPIFIEAARNLASLHINNGLAIQVVFENVLTRSIEEKELKMLEAYYEKRKEHYQKHPKAIKKLFSVGKSSLDPKLHTADLAALTDCCHAILNLSESLTRK